MNTYQFQVTTGHKISIVQESLASTSVALRILIKDCTADELLGARVIAENLADADRRMLILGARIRARLGA